jgi:hypothetical protein
MSRGPGRIQQEVAILIAANADGAWTTADLCQHIYGVKTAEKKHRVSVVRALERMDLPPLWKVWRISPTFPTGALILEFCRQKLNLFKGR